MQLLVITCGGLIIWTAARTFLQHRSSGAWRCLFYADVALASLLSTSALFLTHHPIPSMDANGYPFIVMGSEHINNQWYGPLLIPYFPLTLFADVILWFGICLLPVVFVRFASSPPRKSERS